MRSQTCLAGVVLIIALVGAPAPSVAQDAEAHPEIFLPSEYFDRLDAQKKKSAPKRTSAATLSALAAAGAENVVYLNQNVTPEERHYFYLTGHGTELIQYQWFLALEMADSQKLFSSKEHLVDQLRFIEYKGHPDGLPLGFSKWERKKKAFMGYTCTACHTGQISFQGKDIRIDGGPMLADPDTLIERLSASVNATLQDEDKLERFIERVKNASEEKVKKKKLKKQLKEYSELVEDWLDQNKPTHPFGYGRNDSFGILNNQYLAVGMDIPENFKRPNAPVRTSYIWDTTDAEWRHWNGAVSVPMINGVNEPYDVFGKVRVEKGFILDHFTNQFQPRRVFELENVARKLKAPPWPEDILGKIDRDKAARGRALWHQRKDGVKSCYDCHWDRKPHPRTKPNLYGAQFIRVNMTPVEEVKTDPLMSANFALRKVKTGEFSSRFLFKDEVPVYDAWKYFLGGSIASSYLDHGIINPLEILELHFFRHMPPPGIGIDPPNLSAYKARNLEGAWATGPYLHNGSVPNLHQLLLPASQRDKTFFVGQREYDPVHVGLVTTQLPDSYLYDTSIPGNSNSGHEYGTTFSDTEKEDLIEYFKTLGNPDFDDLPAPPHHGHAGNQ